MLTKDLLQRALAYEPRSERPFLIVPKHMLKAFKDAYSSAGVDIYEAKPIIQTRHTPGR